MAGRDLTRRFPPRGSTSNGSWRRMMTPPRRGRRVSIRGGKKGRGDGVEHGRERICGGGRRAVCAGGNRERRTRGEEGGGFRCERGRTERRSGTNFDESRLARFRPCCRF